ncbi:hypothetical protein G9A89_004593 [Geosiphon pyriformis]|nr:hypothetical protein G9A89_004593 [Geosiphon pyriformis]
MNNLSANANLSAVPNFGINGSINQNGVNAQNNHILVNNNQPLSFLFAHYIPSESTSHMEELRQFPEENVNIRNNSSIDTSSVFNDGAFQVVDITFHNTQITALPINPVATNSAIIVRPQNQSALAIPNSANTNPSTDTNQTEGFNHGAE